MQGLEFSSDYSDQAQEIIDLFESTFTDSEGENEGKLIGGLVKDLLSTTPLNDLLVFTASVDNALVAGIIFSRLSYDEDDRSVFILSPVAVETGRQGQGIGQALINHGLGELRKHGINIAITYGDPNYYSKVGFEKISEDIAKAPLELKHPEGWLAQPLNSDVFEPLVGPVRCP